MRKDELSSRLHGELSGVHVSPQLRRQTLLAAQGKEEKNMKMRNKISFAAAFALAAVLICAVALAAAGRAGMIDFAGRYMNTYVPEDAASYVQKNVATLEEEAVTVSVRELYYDGRIARMTVDVTPKSDKMLLVGPDASMDDPWQNLTANLNGEWDETDTRHIFEVYREKGYTSAYNVDVWLDQEDGENLISGSMDYTLAEDGTLTIYTQAEYEDDKPERNAKLSLCVVPYSDPANDQLDYEKRIITQQGLLLTAVQNPMSGPVAEGVMDNAYVSTESVVYEQVGVRVDRLLIEVKPQEIYATIDYTIVDEEAFKKTDGGLFFEYIDPDAVSGVFSEQRLLSGLSGGGGVRPLDGGAETATKYRQTETLGKNELHDTYTLRAFECWEKTRFETHTFTMRPATQEDL